MYPIKQARIPPPPFPALRRRRPPPSIPSAVSPYYKLQFFSGQKACIFTQHVRDLALPIINLRPRWFYMPPFAYNVMWIGACCAVWAVLGLGSIRQPGGGDGHGELRRPGAQVCGLSGYGPAPHDRACLEVNVVKYSALRVCVWTNSCQVLSLSLSYPYATYHPPYPCAECHWYAEYHPLWAELHPLP